MIVADEFGQKLIELLPNLRRFAISLCKSSDIANDLVQITCEKALLNRDRFELGTRMDAWLFRILKNSWIDRIRRTKTQGTVIDIDDAHDLVGHDGAKETEQRLALNEASRAIAKLPEEHREVLVLVCVDELSYREAAQVLGLPIGTVMSRLARARKKLSSILGINDAPKRSANRKGVS